MIPAPASPVPAGGPDAAAMGGYSFLENFHYFKHWKFPAIAPGMSRGQRHACQRFTAPQAKPGGYVMDRHAQDRTGVEITKRRESLPPARPIHIGTAALNVARADDHVTRIEHLRHLHQFLRVMGEVGIHLGAQAGDPVDVVASPSLRLSPHVLYTNVVEPILRWTFVEKGYALVHGATLAFGDEGCMVTARTDTGKTTTLLKILAYQRRSSDQAAFLSDDMTIVSPDGTAMTYPKPLTISFHTLRAIDADTLEFKERLTLPLQSRIHSRTGRRFAFIISKTHLPAATINMVLQMLVPPPKYFVNKLIPKVKVARKAALRRMFIIERGEPGIESIDNHEAMEVLLQNCEDAYGFPPYEALKEFLYFRDGVDLREQEHAIIRKALGELPATVIRSDTFDWWSQIPAFVNNEQVSADIARAREVEVAQDRYSRQPEVVSIQ